MSSLHWHSFGAGHKQVKNYLSAMSSRLCIHSFPKIIADPYLNLSRRFPLDTDCNTQTKKLLLENQKAVPVHHSALA